MYKNKLSEYKILEEERRYYGHFVCKIEFVKWMYDNTQAFEPRWTSLIKSMSIIEKYIITKRKRVYIPESMTNPFFLNYKPLRSIVNENGVINFPANSKRKPDLKLTGVCKKEFESLMVMVSSVNKDRSSDEFWEVVFSPIRTSLKGKPIKNGFAVKIIYPDESITCIYHLIGRYHIATNVVN